MIRRSFIGGLLSALGLGFLGPQASARPLTLVKTETLSLARYHRTNKLRVWTLGSLEHRILPTEEAVDRLAEKLSKWDGQSDLDLIWGPELSVQQFDLDAPTSMDVVTRADKPIQVESAGHDENGQPTVRLVLTAPHVRIIERGESHG